MSALGHKRTFAAQKGMSALPPKADIDGWSFNVRFVPISDSCTRQTASLFDYLVCDLLDMQRHVEA
jgi:hypothetical protein